MTNRRKIILLLVEIANALDGVLDEYDDYFDDSEFELTELIIDSLDELIESLEEE